jgi:RNA polymerase sigma factor (TIGR02999 family)
MPCYNGGAARTAPLPGNSTVSGRDPQGCRRFFSTKGAIAMEPTPRAASAEGETANPDPAATGELFRLAYDELRRMAERCFTRERTGHTLQATALVHEACLRLMDAHPSAWNDTGHFFRTAATVMRHLLINHARDRRRQKRGGDVAVLPMDSVVVAWEARSLDLIAPDEALEKLSGLDARQAQLVELRFFAGLSKNEVAEVLGVSLRTAENDWALARSFLLREVKKGSTVRTAGPGSAAGAQSP